MAKKRRWTFATVGPIIARIAVGGVLLYAGSVKLGDMSAVAEDVGHYRLLPEVLHNIFAILLPWNEVVIGSMLILSLWPRAVSLLSAGIFGMFAIAVTQKRSCAASTSTAAASATRDRPRSARKRWRLTACA